MLSQLSDQKRRSGNRDVLRSSIPMLEMNIVFEMFEGFVMSGDSPIFLNDPQDLLGPIDSQTLITIFFQESPDVSEKIGKKDIGNG
jgi:hypothetical protein